MKSSNWSFIRSGALALSMTIAGTVLTLPTVVADENAETESAAADVATPADAQEGRTAISGNLHFTDEEGNRREPTAAEIKEAAEAFQRDLARLAGQHKGKSYERTRPDGTVIATVGPSKLVFLTVQESDDGTLRYGHSSMDEDGNVTFEPATSPPEK